MVRWFFLVNLLTILTVGSLSAFASNRFLTYQGRITNLDGTPLEYSAVQFAFEITSQSGTCVLYRETSSVVDMTNSKGVFDISIGNGSVDAGVPTGNNIESVFKNDVVFNCVGGGTYNAGDGHNRKLRVRFRDAVGWRLITPDQEIRGVPFASFAQNAAVATRLGSSLESDFLKSSTLPVCAAGEFLRHVSPAGTFLCETPAGLSTIPDNSITTVKIATGAVTESKIADGAISNDKIQDATINDAKLNLISTPGKVSGSAITSGTIGGSTSINTSGLIQTNAGLRLFSAGNYVEQKAPAGLSSSYALHWPIDAGLSGQSLTTDGSGNLAWTTIATGLTSLGGQTGATQTFAVGTTGTAPAFSSASNTHTLNIPMASTAGTTAGLISKTDYDAFAGKLGTSSAFSGDVSGTSSTMSVDKIKGTGISITSLGSGQYLKYDGSNWINSVLSVNLTSDITGTLPVANGGTGATTASGARTNLGLGTAATKNTGVLSGEVPLIGAAGITNNSMCTSDGTGAITCSTAIPSARGDFKADGSVNMTGTLKAVTGTAALPGVTFVGDTNTGLYSPSADSFAFATGGGERLRVDSSGRVGIGTTAPTSLLHVSGSTFYPLTLENSGSGVGLVFKEVNSSGGDEGLYATANEVRIAVDGSDRFKATSTGAEISGQIKITGGTPGVGKVLTSDATGLATWTTPSSGGITSLNGLTAGTQTFAIGTTGTAPNFVSTTSTHTLHIPMASTAGVTAGLISKDDHGTFSAKLGPASAFGGDVSGTYTTTSVDKIKGNAVAVGSLTAPDAGKVYRWNGTSFAASFLNFGDLRTAAGAQQLTAACAANEKIQWSVITDAFTCQSISNLNASVITAGTIDSARLPASANSWTVSGSDIYRDTGKVGVGTTSPGAKMHIDGNTLIGNLTPFPAAFSGIADEAQLSVLRNHTETTGTKTGVSIFQRFNPSANSTFGAHALAAGLVPNVPSGVTVTSTNEALWAMAARNRYAGNTDSGTVSHLYAGAFIYGHQNDQVGQTPITTNAVGVRISPTALSGTITNMYDLLLGTKTTGGTVTNHWGVYQEDAAIKNYFAGFLGVGTNTPYTRLSNIAIADSWANPGDANGTGQNQNSLTWNTGAAGYTTAITNSSTAGSANGLQVRTAGTASTNRVFTAGTGVTGGAGNPNDILTVVGNGRVGINTVAPATQLEVVDTTGGLRGIVSTTYSANPGGLFMTRGARGTVAAPTALTLGDTFGWYAFSGHTGSGFNYPGQPTGIAAIATENWSTTANGSLLKFNTIPNGTANGLERMRIDHNGRVGINTTTPAAHLDVTGGLMMMSVDRAVQVDFVHPELSSLTVVL